MQGYQAQMKLADAIRYLRERNRYVLDRPVEKRETPQTTWQQWVEKVYGRTGMVADEGSRV